MFFPMTWSASALWVALTVTSLASALPNAIDGKAPSSSDHGDLGARDSSDTYPWAAIGDSFAAGPGAGESYDEVQTQCYRNKGAYPPQLSDDFPFPNNKMQFLACTGDTVDDMINTQLQRMNEDQQIVTLSIGGNDIGFAKILQACIFKPAGPKSDDCQEVIDEAWTFKEEKLYDILWKGYDAVFDRIGPDVKRKVFVQLYPSFFNEDTPWCETQTMGLFPGYKPKLTKDLRHRLNALADALNGKIKIVIRDYSKKHKEPAHADGGWWEDRLFYLDEFDLLTYPGHRFCEKDKETFDDESIWFFVPEGNDSPKNSVAQSSNSNTTAGEISVKYDASTCKDDPRADRDGVFGWGCDLAVYVKNENVTSTTTMFAPEFLVKAFHPKTAAFTEIYKQHRDFIREKAWDRDKDVDQGILNCRAEHDDGDEKYYFSRENALQAIAKFCEDTHQDKKKWGDYIVTGDDQITLSVAYDEPPTCPTLDRTADNWVAVCKDRLGIPLENCDVTKRSSNAWKQGGIFHRDCMTWSVGRPSAFNTYFPNGTVTGLQRVRTSWVDPA